MYRIFLCRPTLNLESIIKENFSNDIFSVSKVYVQDILQNELETKVCNILHKEEGHLYVCGDVRMARDVAQTLKRMLVKNLDHTEKQAEEYFFQLKVFCDVEGILSIQTVLQHRFQSHSPDLAGN